jgi:lysophospholipase L1-like esterase
MKKFIITFTVLILTLFMPEISLAQDWANLEYYKNANVKLGSPSPGEDRIVFLGNSITESWKDKSPKLFSNISYVNRGISGQTTPQILKRLKSDAIDLQPTILIILAGINDIAENTGPITLKEIADNIKSMAEQAKSNGIEIILSSVLPAYDFPWNPGLNPAEKIITLNEIIKNYSQQNEILYLDYFSSMVDQRNGLKDEYTYDGVHPNERGYELMTKLVTEAIEKILKQK